MAGSFKIRFFVGAARLDGAELLLSTAFKMIHAGEASNKIARGSEVYFLKGLESWNENRNFKGVLAKMRTKNLPHKGDAAGYEEEIELGPDQGLVEKSHFIYTQHRKLLIFQQNFYGCTVSTLAEILGRALGAAASFDPVVKADAMARLLRGESSLRTIDISVARPTNPTMFPRDNFSAGILQVLNSTKAATFSVHMSANGPGSRGNSFRDRTKRAIQALVEGEHATKAQVEIEEGGQIIPIDLLADSVSSRQDVEMDGRYPITESMFNALERARQEVRGELDQYFGRDAEALT